VLPAISEASTTLHDLQNFPLSRFGNFFSWAECEVGQVAAT
jgi:hypothetical protein